MKGRTYALLVLVVLSALAGSWVIDHMAKNSDFRVVVSLKKIPAAILSAAFGGRESIADSSEPWNPGAPNGEPEARAQSASQAAPLSATARPLPGQRFLLARAYGDGHWQLEFQRGGEAIQNFVAELKEKNGVWEKSREDLKEPKEGPRSEALEPQAPAPESTIVQNQNASRTPVSP